MQVGCSALREALNLSIVWSILVETVITLTEVLKKSEGPSSSLYSSIAPLKQAYLIILCSFLLPDDDPSLLRVGGGAMKSLTKLVAPICSMLNIPIRSLVDIHHKLDAKYFVKL